jgi:hydrogenase maturation protease
MRRVLIACVGNILRGDDGFGVVVAEHLAAETLPPGVDLIETGIGGMSIVQQLMDGYDALIVVDAVDRSAPPGTLFVLQPAVADPGCLSTDEWRQQFSNLHLAEPSRVLLLARAAGVLPPTVTVVGCQPECIEDYEPSLSLKVRAAVPIAARRILELATSLATAQVA